MHDNFLHEHKWPFSCQTPSILQACGSAASALEMLSSLHVCNLLWQTRQHSNNYALHPAYMHLHTKMGQQTQTTLFFGRFVL